MVSKIEVLGKFWSVEPSKIWMGLYDQSTESFEKITLASFENYLTDPRSPSLEFLTLVISSGLVDLDSESEVRNLRLQVSASIAIYLCAMMSAASSNNSSNEIAIIQVEEYVYSFRKKFKNDDELHFFQLIQKLSKIDDKFEEFLKKTVLFSILSIASEHFFRTSAEKFLYHSGLVKEQIDDDNAFVKNFIVNFDIKNLNRYLLFMENTSIRDKTIDGTNHFSSVQNSLIKEEIKFGSVRSAFVKIFTKIEKIKDVRMFILLDKNSFFDCDAGNVCVSTPQTINVIKQLLNGPISIVDLIRQDESANFFTKEKFPTAVTRARDRLFESTGIDDFLPDATSDGKYKILDKYLFLDLSFTSIIGEPTNN
jgi:hypothetical protein